MNLTVGQVHDLFVALGALEQNDVRLVGRTRLDIAININLLKPVAESYEGTRLRAFADVENAARDAAPKVGPNEMQARMVTQNIDMRNAPVAIESLRPLKIADLKLDENPKISGALLAHLAPLFEGME